MSYILFLGFKCIVYKKPPTVRVSLNDIFLDEYSLTPHRSFQFNEYFIPNKELQKKVKHKLDPSAGHYTKIMDNINQLIDKDIMFYGLEIDQNILQENNCIKIEYLDLVNNFNNGFMTKTTLISLQCIFLFPKNVLLNPSNFLDTFYCGRDTYKKRSLDINSLIKYYQQPTIELFNIVYNNLQDTKIKNNLPKHYVYDKINFFNLRSNKLESIIGQQWVGTNGYFNLDFDKKSYEENVDLIDFSNTNITPRYLLFLSNKYKQYAN